MVNNLANRVRARMDFLGFEQKDLAARCGVTQPHISRLLSGKVDRPTFIYELSLALGKSVKWLLTGEDEPMEQYVDFYTKYRPFIDAFNRSNGNTKKSILLLLGLADGDGEESEKKISRSNGSV